MSRRVYVSVPMICAVFSVGAFDLVRNSQAQAVAVVGEHPAPTTLTAANELTNYVYQMTGVKMQVSATPVPGLHVVMLGTDYKAVKTDEVCIRLTTRRLN